MQLVIRIEWKLKSKKESYIELVCNFKKQINIFHIFWSCRSIFCVSKSRVRPFSDKGHHPLRTPIVRGYVSLRLVCIIPS